MATAHNSIRAVVLLLVEKVLHPGERVVATLRRPEHLADLASKYPSTQLLVVELDVVKTEHIERAFEQTKKHFGRLDIVVNNAGYGLFAEIEVAPEEETRKQIEVLFWGPVHIIKRAIPFMRDINPSGQGGHILNISSSGGHQAHPGIAFYNAGKFALEGLTESLSKEMLPEWNIIKATIVEPGGFRTSWGHSSLVKVRTLPAYEQPHAPFNVLRNMLGHDSFLLADPKKAADAMFSIAGRKDLPLRIQLGTDAHMMVVAEAEKTIKNAKTAEWEALAHSTNFDGVDTAKIVEQLTAALKA